MLQFKYYAIIGMILGSVFTISNIHAPVLSVLGESGQFQVMDVIPRVEDECDNAWGAIRGLLVSRYYGRCESGQKNSVLYEVKVSGKGGTFWVDSYREVRVGDTLSVIYIDSNPGINSLKTGWFSREIRYFSMGALLLLVCGYVLRREIRCVT